jgi:hypothetical protein
MLKSPYTPQPQTPKIASRSQRASRNERVPNHIFQAHVTIKKDVPGIAMPVGREKQYTRPHVSQENAKEREKNRQKKSSD